MGTDEFEPLNKASVFSEEVSHEDEAVADLEVNEPEDNELAKVAEKPEASSDEVVIKQAVIDVPKSGTVRLKVHGLRGGFRGVRFGDDHVSNEPVSAEDRAALVSQFPNAVIEEVDE